MVALRILVCAARATLLSWICSASSRVGARISVRVWRSLPSVSRSRMGRRKAAVLPVPVWARPMRSRPSSASGMARSWIGVGWVKPACWTAARMPRVQGKLFKLQKKALLGFIEPSRTLSPMSVSLRTICSQAQALTVPPIDATCNSARRRWTSRFYGVLLMRTHLGAGKGGISATTPCCVLVDPWLQLHRRGDTGRADPPHGAS